MQKPQTIKFIFHVPNHQPVEWGECIMHRLLHSPLVWTEQLKSACGWLMIFTVQRSIFSLKGGSQTDICTIKGHYFYVVCATNFKMKRLSFTCIWEVNVLPCPRSERYCYFPRTLKFLSYYAVRALHRKLTALTLHQKGNSTVWVYQGKLTEPELERGSWLLILCRHSTGKAVIVMTSLHLAEGMKRTWRGTETLTFGLMRRPITSDFTGTDAEVLLIHKIL